MRRQRFNADKHLISRGHAGTGLGEEAVVRRAIYKPDEIRTVNYSCDASNGFRLSVPRDEVVADGDLGRAGTSVWSAGV